MSFSQTPRERELQATIKDRDKTIQDLESELEEKEDLLVKAKGALQELQEALTTRQREEETLRNEAQGIIDEQAEQLRAFEERVQQLESQLSVRHSDLRDVTTAKQRALEEAESARHQAELEATSVQARLREKERQVVSLQEDLAAARNATTSLERAVKEARATAATSTSDAAAKTKDIQTLTTEVKMARSEAQALQSKLIDVEQQLAVAQQSLAAAQKAARAASGDKEDTEKAMKAKLHEIKAECEARVKEAERKLSDAAGGWSVTSEVREREWAQRLQDVEVSWEKRMRDGLAACEAKFAEEGSEWKARVARIESEWAARLAETEAIWASRLSEAQHASDLERASLDTRIAAIRQDEQAKLAAQMEDLRQRLTAQLEEAQGVAKAEREALEQSWSSRLQAAESSWSAKMESAQSKWAGDRATAAHSWAEKTADMEAAAKQQIEETEQRAAQKIQELQSQHAAKLRELHAEHAAVLDAAHKAAAKEREVLAASWQSRLDAAEKSAQRQQTHLQEETDRKVATITQRLSSMSVKETKRDACSKEMSRQLDELQATYAAELARRSESEAAAKEAAALYRSQLEHQRTTIDALQAELRTVQLDGLSTSCSMRTGFGQSLTDSAMTGHVNTSPGASPGRVSKTTSITTTTILPTSPRPGVSHHALAYGVHGADDVAATAGITMNAHHNTLEDDLVNDVHQVDAWQHHAAHHTGNAWSPTLSPHKSTYLTRSYTNRTAASTLSYPRVSNNTQANVATPGNARDQQEQELHGSVSLSQMAGVPSVTLAGPKPSMTASTPMATLSTTQSAQVKSAAAAAAVAAEAQLESVRRRAAASRHLDQEVKALLETPGSATSTPGKSRTASATTSRTSTLDDIRSRLGSLHAKIQGNTPGLSPGKIMDLGGNLKAQTGAGGGTGFIGTQISTPLATAFGSKTSSLFT